MKENNLTGYPSIDRPHVKYYKSIPTRDLEKYNTIYDMVFQDRNLEDEAISFLDGHCCWTLGKLKEVTDKCINALNKINIEEGDNVLFGVTNSPEMLTTLIAIVSVGATAKFFDIRASEKDICDYANSSNCKYMVALDNMVMPKVEKIINETNLKKVFVLRLGNSLTVIEKIKYALHKRFKLEKVLPMPSDSRFIELTEFINTGSPSNAKRVAYDENRPAIKVQSSGTTGRAKTIVHTEKSAVEFAKVFAYLDLPVGKGTCVLVALPPWIAYGLGNAILMPLALGSKIEMCPDFDSNAVFRNIGRFTLSFAAPFHYRFIRDNYEKLSAKKKKELSEVECMVTGGDKYSAEENISDEKLFGTVIINGYGNNEGWGALTANPASANHPGTVGIPRIGDTIIICDPNTKEELPYRNIGDVCVLSTTRFTEYEGNESETERILQIHQDGKKWLHTGDRGFIDEEGFLHLEGRNERVIIRQGFKLSAYTIEDAITSLDCVDECITVEAPDELEEHVPMAFVVRSKDCKLKETDLVNQIVEKVKMRLKKNEIPKYIIEVDSLKYTDNNKYDFRWYEQLALDYVQKKET